MSKKATADQQVGTMQALSQAAAAWLAGVDPRTLRDTASIPRDADGRYNARDILKWARDRVRRPPVSEEDLERLRVVFDYTDVRDDEITLAAGELIQQLRDAHGEAVLVLLGELIADEWVELALAMRQAEAVQESPAARRAREDQERHDQEMAEARRALRVVRRCECGRICLRGKWIRADQPADHDLVPSLCPECDRKYRTRRD